METEKKYVLDKPVRLKGKTDDFAFIVHEYNVDLASNQIYLFGVDDYIIGAGSNDSQEPGVEFVMANKFIKNLNVCMRVNPDKPILVHMKTCGGSWEEGMAIYDAIKSCPSPVTILNYTHARSMSSLIFQAANKRVMMPHSYFMVHDGTLEASGTVKSVTSYIDFAKNASLVMMSIYLGAVKHHGSLKGKKDQDILHYLRSRMNKKEEVYFTADEAVEHGFADEVFNYDWSKLCEYTEEQLRR